MLTSLALGLSIGSLGSEGRAFLADSSRRTARCAALRFFGGVVFNLANLLIVAAIDVAGMAVAFPVAIGLALVIGVVVNYLATPGQRTHALHRGGARGGCGPRTRGPTRWGDRPGTGRHGLVLSVLSGLMMGFFYRFVAASMISDSPPGAGAAHALFRDVRLHLRRAA